MHKTPRLKPVRAVPWTRCTVSCSCEERFFTLVASTGALFHHQIEKSTPWASGSSPEKLTVLVARRM